MTTTEELELWRLHMWAGITNENLLAWCAAVVDAGLCPAGYVEEMAAKFGGGSPEDAEDLD